VELNLAELVQTVSDRQQATERQLSELTATIKALEAQVAELSKSAAPRPTSKVAAPAAAAQPNKESNKAEVTPEILVVLAAAVTAFLGKEVRIRSAKMLQSPYEVVNPWSQLGRVVVQASHNLHIRR
jgi:methylmalonyl-CoA carboxyltransferase large subunit